jgi:hypothetical protein
VRPRDAAIGPETCEACGFDGSAYGDDDLVGAVRSLGPRWAVLVDDAGDDLRSRPAPGVWSAIEYAAHTRDIVALHVVGVEQALTREEPVHPEFAEGFADSVADSYSAEDPNAVVEELTVQADRLATVAEAAGPAEWGHGLTIGVNRTDVRRLLEHALHDAVHHLDDVERGLGQLRSSS